MQSKIQLIQQQIVGSNDKQFQLEAKRLQI